jgi:hypothetical protein
MSDRSVKIRRSNVDDCGEDVPGRRSRDEFRTTLLGMLSSRLGRRSVFASKACVLMPSELKTMSGSLGRRLSKIFQYLNWLARALQSRGTHFQIALNNNGRFVVDSYSASTNTPTTLGGADMSNQEVAGFFGQGDSSNRTVRVQCATKQKKSPAPWPGSAIRFCSRQNL